MARIPSEKLSSKRRYEYQVCIYIYRHTYIYIWLWIKTRVVAGPPPLLQAFVAAGVSSSLSRISHRYDCTYYLKAALCFGRFVAERFVAEHPCRPCLLQTYVAKWPPQPVTNPVFFIRRHIYIYTYIYIYTTQYQTHTCIYIYLEPPVAVISASIPESI